MKSLYTLLFMSIVLGVSAQVEGTWRLAQIPGALASVLDVITAFEKVTDISQFLQFLIVFYYCYLKPLLES